MHINVWDVSLYFQSLYWAEDLGRSLWLARQVFRQWTMPQKIRWIFEKDIYRLLLYFSIDFIFFILRGRYEQWLFLIEVMDQPMLSCLGSLRRSTFTVTWAVCITAAKSLHLESIFCCCWKFLRSEKNSLTQRQGPIMKTYASTIISVKRS